MRTASSRIEQSDEDKKLLDRLQRNDFLRGVQPQVGRVDTGIWDAGYHIKTTEQDDEDFHERVIKNLAEEVGAFAAKDLMARQKLKPKIALECDPNPERGAGRFHVG